MVHFSTRLFFVSACLLTLVGTSSAQFAPIGLAHQLTHSDNSDLSLSPDGKQMVLVSVIAGREQLVRMGIDQSNPVQLTRDDAFHEDPAWSPDGKKIAFVLIREGLEQIHTMNPDGSGLEAITPKERRTIHPHGRPTARVSSTAQMTRPTPAREERCGYLLHQSREPADRKARLWRSEHLSCALTRWKQDRIPPHG